MDIKRLEEIIQNPDSVTADDIFELENLSNQYPYAQYLRVLLAKIASQYGNDQKDVRINTAAIYASDRGILKKVITDQNFRITLAPSDFQHFYEKPRAKEVAVDEPTSYNQPDYDSQHEEEFIPYADDQSSESNDLFEEVMKNLRILRSLRKQYEFLEKQENERAAQNENVETEVEPEQKKTINDADIEEKHVHEQEGGTIEEKINQEADITDDLSSTQNEIAEPKDDDHIEKETENSPRNTSANSNIANREYQDDLISRFIEKDPDIKSRRVTADKVSDQNNEDLSVVSTFLDENVVSENLANIFLRQGKTGKAIDIYKKLIWKFPQKKAYFAAQIEDLKKK